MLAIGILSTDLPFYDILVDEGGKMNVKVSPKYQVVIPKDVREKMNIQPGSEVTVFQYMNRIEYIPVKPVQEFRGFVRGMNTELNRDEDRLD